MGRLRSHQKERWILECVKGWIWIAKTKTISFIILTLSSSGSPEYKITPQKFPPQVEHEEQAEGRGTRHPSVTGGCSQR